METECKGVYWIQLAQNKTINFFKYNYNPALICEVFLFRFTY
jgi:hypothetical protein